MIMDINQNIIKTLASGGDIDSYELSKELQVDHQVIVGGIKSLQSIFGEYIEVKQFNESKYELTPEGLGVKNNGSHEAILFHEVTKLSKISKEHLCQKLSADVVKIGLGKALQNGWVELENDGSLIVQIVNEIEDTTQNYLRELDDKNGSLNDEVLLELKRRKLIKEKSVTKFVVRLLVSESQFQDILSSNETSKKETELTSEMIQSGLYKELQFREYNFECLGYPIRTGNLHPLMKIREEFVGILLEMGFSEMSTNRFVENSFWNFDTLFVPQKHPARDMQDTFFVSKPIISRDIPADYMEKIKRVHSTGDYGSLGYGSDWKYEETVKNILRTHTTAISARVLYELGKQKEFTPVKKFSIDRVFRNETLDATHLAEFHQVEGFVADRNLSLGNLIGVMKEFFGRMGLKELRFKPAYNPYTEPSLEVFAYHPGLKKWVEIGNSGLFRPEVLKPANLPDDVRVIAWGLSLERPTMIRYGFDNIRDLVGNKVDLKMVYKNPLCRFNMQATI